MTERMEIETFAFVDIETSGLPDHNFGKTSIIEISIQTCSRQDLLKCSKEQTPRCLNKVVLCFNPSRRIDPESTAISGLDNFMLEDHNTFNENAADLIVNFFHHLRHPVCLVAHNGNKFDYPIINNTFQKLKKVLPEDILCIDSLPAFKYIDDRNNQKKDLENTEDLAQKIDIENDKKFQEALEKEYANIINKERDTLATPKRKEINSSTDSKAGTDVFDEIINWKKLNETTPNRPIEQKFSKKFQTLRNSDNSLCKERKVPKSRRELFPSEGSTATPKNARKSYTLTSVYERCFGEKPKTVHHADDDVATLLKAVVFHGEEFVKYSQLYAKPMSSVPALGSKS